jgi:hypothetical protein
MTRLVMAASAAVMLIAGIACTFAPQELLARIGASAVPPVAVQVAGSLFLGFAMINWMAKDSLIGGIYNRPVAVGNLLHFTSAAIALLKAQWWIAAAVYALFAIAFAKIVFTSPPVGR